MTAADQTDQAESRLAMPWHFLAVRDPELRTVRYSRATTGIPKAGRADRWVAKLG